MTLDIEALRDDLKQECYGAFFGGNFGGALMETYDLERASPEEIVEIAENKGVDFRKYLDDYT